MIADFKKWIMALTLIFGVIVLGFYINKEVDKIQAQRKILADQSSVLEPLELLREDSQNSLAYQEGLENALPVKDRLAEFSEALEQLAKKRNLKLRFNFGDEVLGTALDPGIVNFTAVIIGSYNNFVNFLKDVKISDYLVKFVNLDLKDKGSTHEIIINGQVFYK